MAYLLMFAPWITFAVFTPLGWAGSAAAATAVGLAVLVHARHTGVAWSALLLELGAVVFLAALTVLAVMSPDSELREWSTTAALGWLAVIAWTSLVVKQPFTLGIAKRSVPRELWKRVGFIRANFLITKVWAISFTVAAAAMAITVVVGAPTTVTITLKVVGFVVPMVFTKRYQSILRSRHPMARTEAA